MSKIYLYLITAILFSACSLEPIPNLWKYKSANAFNSYTNNYLRSNDILAKNDLKTAIKHAKMGSDLTALSRIYLGVCALNISIGEEQECNNYKNISDVANSNELDAYYSLITSNIQKEQINLLPKKYQNFAVNLYNKNFLKANDDILNMKKATSQLLAAALIKDKVTKETRDTIIDVASFNGYKKAVIFWLGEAREATNDKHEKQKISKKISILESDE